MYHAPIPIWTQRHHVFPKYLCALLGVPVRALVVPLCATCHGRVHHALVHLINSGANPHRLSAGEAGLVVQAWAWWQSTLAARR